MKIKVSGIRQHISFHSVFSTDAPPPVLTGTSGFRPHLQTTVTFFTRQTRCTNQTACADTIQSLHFDTSHYIYIYTVNFCSNCVDNSSLLWVLAVLFLPFCSTIEDRFSLLPLMSTSAFGNGLWAAIKSF